MRKIIFLLFVFCFAITAVKCSKEEPANNAPSSFNLVFPSNDLLCIDNTITFNWNNAVDPEQDEVAYNIIIARDRQLTDVVENTTVATTQITFNLEKATAYYWQVNAIDVANNQGTKSAIFAFYTQGDLITNYAPFMAEQLTPANNETVNAGSVNLIWNASDINTEDTLTYEVYFGEGNAISLIEDSLTTKNFTVNVESGKSYSWKVNVKDNLGAKAIGQISEFTVN